MVLSDLSGATLGRYHVEELLGQGDVGVVYRATQQPRDEPVALKVLDPQLAGRPGFMRRFVSQTATISKLGHPGIVPVFEIGTRSQVTYVTMRLVRGGTLKTLLAEGPLEIGAVWRLLRAIADALHSAHEVGVVHQDLKPSNVLIDDDGAVLLTDFGLARINYGYAVGTPGYMAPEQAMGLEVDRRADVHALGLLAYEMLTGSRPYSAKTRVDLILSTVFDPVPSPRTIDPELPAELEGVLFKALAKDPRDRPDTVVALLGELSRVPMGQTRPATRPSLLTGAGPSIEQTWGSDYQPVTLFEASLDPVLAVDEAGLITHWNSQAESLFGWTRRQILGLPLLRTLIAPRYREMLERVLATAITERAPGEGQAVEVEAVHRDGQMIPLELSISSVRLGPNRANLVAFCRDISERKESERLRSMQESVTDALSELGSREELPGRLVELICTNLDWAAGALWRLQDGELRCARYWQSSALESSELERMTKRTTYRCGVGVPGKVLSGQESVWHPELVRVAESAREMAALRSGMQAVGAFHLHDGMQPIGVFEFFSAATGPAGAARMARVDTVARRAARQLSRLWAQPEHTTDSAALPATLRVLAAAPTDLSNEAPTELPVEAPGDEAEEPQPERVELGQVRQPAATRRLRYRIDKRKSRVGFSCTFMKFLTVHGQFRDFSGWVDIEGDDPQTTRAECVVKTASVDTGSLDRDYHLCSRDFFDVDTHPDMIFKSAGVDIRDEERFRLHGELIIRNVSRPIVVDVSVEERERDAKGGERATLTASTVIHRSDWFLDWEEALEAGRWIVGEQIKLDLELNVYRRASALVTAS